MTTTTDAITRRPGRCGGDACVRDTRVPVWSLVERRRAGLADADILRALPDLTAADLAAAWEYAATHPDEIERAQWENDAAMADPTGEAAADLVRRGRRFGLTDDAIRNAFDPPMGRDALLEI